MSGMMYGRRRAARDEDKVYKMLVRHAMMFDLETGASR